MKNQLKLPQLIQILPDSGRAHAIDWWQNLSEAQRLEFADLWEESLEKDAQGLVLVGFDADRGYIFKGTFREGDDVDMAEFDDDEQFDYFFNMAVPGYTSPVYRVFHVCMAHPAARACLDHGRIPHNFSCPLDDEKCLMKTILTEAKGRDVVLKLIGAA